MIRINLVIVEEMANGFYNAPIDKENIRRKELQDKMISFFPLVMATSYKYLDLHEDKVEYIIPELVMRSLKKFGIMELHIYQNMWNMICNFK